MSVEVLHDQDRNLAVLFCNTSDWAFGPLFRAEDGGSCLDAAESAEVFLAWLKPIDPRSLSDDKLEGKYLSWISRKWRSKP
jgi:hypothetical protein